VSLYQVRKFLYQLNRDPSFRDRFDVDRDGVLGGCRLTDEERDAIVMPDIGLLHVME
jgi:hypothetical protein